MTLKNIIRRLAPAGRRSVDWGRSAALPGVQVLAAAAVVAGLYLLTGLGWTLLVAGLAGLTSTILAELLPLLRGARQAARRKPAKAASR